MNPDQLIVLLNDPLINYHLEDHTGAILDTDTISPDPVAVLVLDVRHIAADSPMRLAIRIAPAGVPVLVSQLSAMEASLRQQGAI